MKTLGVTLLLVGVSSASGGCVPRYQAPAPNEPHALVKLRRTYEKTAGQVLEESAALDDFRAFEASANAKLATEVRTDAILVHPGPATLTFASTFSHQESRLVTEEYYEREPHYETEYYQCGTFNSPRQCSRSATKYRQVRKTRLVTKSVSVADGSCSGGVVFEAANGGVYLIQFTYQEHGVCALSCFEQSSTGGTELAQRAPCHQR